MHRLSHSDATVSLCSGLWCTLLFTGTWFFGIDLSVRRMYCACIDGAPYQGRMDGALFTIFFPTHSVWLVIARNAFIQSQCTSSTPRLVGESAGCAGTVGVVEPGERTGAVFPASPAAGTRSAVASAAVLRTGRAGVLILHKFLAAAAFPTLATSGR